MFKAKLSLIVIANAIFFNSYAKSTPDTSVVRSYLKKAESYYKVNSDSAFLYSQKALNETSYIQNYYLLSEIYKTHGIAFYLKTRYDSSSHYLNMAIRCVPNNGTLYLSSLYDTYASALIMHNKYDTALFYIQKAFDINKKLKVKKELMKNYANFGLAYNRMNAFDISTRYVYQGLPIAEELKDTMAIMKFLQTIAVNYQLMKKTNLAILYSKTALDYALKIKNYKRVSEIANTIANCHQDLKQYKEAKDYYQLSYNYAHKIHYPTMEAAALSNIGLYYAVVNQLDSAWFYLAKGYTIAQKYNYVNIITAVNITYSKIYTETKQYNKALKYLLAVIGSKNQVESSLVDAAYLQISDVYKTKGDYANAYKYRVIYAQRNDSAINKEKTEEIASIKMQYELNKKQEQMDAKLQAEAERYKLIRNIIITGFIATLIIATLVIISYRFKQKQKILNLKNEINSYRQRLMAQQMNPHFIFNTLNSIQYFIYNNKKEESMDFVSQFAHLMRLNLYNSQNEIIALKDEVEALKLYLELERIRLDNKFEYKIEIDPAIDVKTQLVPSFLIQPIVENSIKHGILKTEHKGNIQTKIKRKNGSLVYIVVDNGIGFEKATGSQKKAEHISYGLELTKKRIILLGILNNKKTDFTFTDIKMENGECLGAKVELVFPSTLKAV